MKRDDRRAPSSEASARGVVRVEANALREHGQRERVDRVWERLEPKLTLGRKRAHGVPRWPLVAAAVAAGFALGLGSAPWLGGHEDAVDPVVMAPANVPRASDVFAAGTTARSYPLPGGGTITLDPGSIVDTVSRDGDRLTLRLVRGNATVAAALVGSVDLMVGSAQVRPTRGARVQVHREGDHALLEVWEGSAEVVAPNEADELVTSHLGAGDVRRMRVHHTTASVPNVLPLRPMRPRALHDDDTPYDGTPEDVTPAVTPLWEIACKEEKDDERTVQLLQQDPGAAASITDPAVLACVARGHQLLGNQTAAVSTYEKLLDQPDKLRALQAAMKLQRIYEKRRDAAKSEEEKQAFAAQAQAYAQKRRQLSLAALSEGQDLEAFERAEALCNRIQAEAGVSNWKAVTSLSAQYKGAYPNGPCTATIEGILAKTPVAADAGGADEAPEDDSPYEEPAP